jgi:hypothetical protein
LTDANVSEVAIAMGSLLSPISGTLSLVVGIVSQRYLDQSYQVMALRLLIPGMDSSGNWKFKWRLSGWIDELLRLVHDGNTSVGLMMFPVRLILHSRESGHSICGGWDRCMATKSASIRSLGCTADCIEIWARHRTRLFLK